MIIAVDTNILIKMITSHDIADFRNYFHDSDDTIAIFPPVLAEFLVYENQARTSFLQQNKKLFTQMYPLNIKCAKIIAELTRRWLEFKRDNQIDVEKNRHAIKIDMQIIGMCIANDIKTIITHDKDIPKIVDGLNLDINVLRYTDIKPLQPSLDLHS